MHFLNFIPNSQSTSIGTKELITTNLNAKFPILANSKIAHRRLSWAIEATKTEKRKKNPKIHNTLEYDHENKSQARKFNHNTQNISSSVFFDHDWGRGIEREGGIPQILMGAWSSRRLGCWMKISRAARQSCRISDSDNWTCFPGRASRTSKSRLMMSSNTAGSIIGTPPWPWACVAIDVQFDVSKPKPLRVLSPPIRSIESEQWENPNFCIWTKLEGLMGEEKERATFSAAKNQNEREGPFVGGISFCLGTEWWTEW